MLERSGPRTCALALAASIVLSAAPALGDPRVEARRHFQDGMALIREGKYEEGTSELYEAYRILPHPVVLYNIGRAFFDAGKYDRAVQELERYLATEPADQAEVERLIDVARAHLREDPRGGGVEPLALPARPVTPTNGALRPGTARDVSHELADLRQQLRQILDRVDTLQGTIDSSASGSARLNPRAPLRAGADAAPAGQRDLSLSDGAAAARTATAAEEDVSQRGAVQDPYGPVVITSSRYGQSPLDAPNAVSIITGEELRASGVTSIPDALRRVPGIDVMAMSPADYNIGIRGFNDRLANKVLVLVDGRSVYMDFIGATNWPLLSISAADIERIEVVRGPGAALYGANAFSGVINIITKSPGQSGDGPAAEVWGGFPEQGGASLRLTDRVGATAYRVSGSIERKSRWYREVDPARREYELMAPHPDDSVRVGRFDARLDHRLAPRTSVSVSGGIASGQDEFVAIGSLRDFYINGYHSYLRADLLLPEGFSVRTFWNHVDLDADQWARPVGGISLASHSVTDVVDVEVQSYREVDLGITQRFNIGAGYRFKSARWDWLGSEPDENHLSLFFQDEALLLDNLHAIFSLRLDRHPLLVDIEGAPFTDRYAISPRGALVWRVVPGHSIHVTAGTAFRTPTLLESYISTAVPTTTDAVVVRNVGNRDLLPERVFSTEIGWRSEPASSRYRLEAAAYFNRISSLIQLSEVRPWPAGQPNYDADAGVWYGGDTTYENTGEDYDAFGGELGGSVFPIDGLDLYASGAYERIDQGNSKVESTSPLKLSAGGQYRVRAFTFGADVHFASSQTWPLRSFDQNGQVMVTDVELPAYVWAGARLSYMIPQSRLELAIAGQNLLSTFQSAVTPADGDMSQVTTPDRTHREHPLGQPIPISVFASLTYRIW
jgi:outer membrane receptor protein involved in Fe transport